MSHVEVARRDQVLEVTLNKPKFDAIDRAMSQDMGRAFALLRDDPDLWCALLTGAGDRIFSAGLDWAVPDFSTLSRRQKTLE